MEHHANVILVNPYKSVAGSIILTLFLGPIGLLYSSFWGSIIMLILIAISLLFPHYVGVLFLLFWVVTLFWGVVATNRYNRKLFEKVTCSNPKCKAEQKIEQPIS